MPGDSLCRTAAAAQALTPPAEYPRSMHDVGMDLIEIEDVHRSLTTFGARYLERVFTAAERASCGAAAPRLAEAFAAKEATIKALGVIEGGFSWHAVEVCVGPGSPTVRLDGAVAEAARRRGVRDIRISLTRTRRQAAAVAVIEADR